MRQSQCATVRPRPHLRSVNGGGLTEERDVRGSECFPLAQANAAPAPAKQNHLKGNKSWTFEPWKFSLVPLSPPAGVGVGNRLQGQCGGTATREEAARC